MGQGWERVSGNLSVDWRTGRQRHPALHIVQTVHLHRTKLTNPRCFTAIYWVIVIITIQIHDDSTVKMMPPGIVKCRA